jgi:hypothetical protein
MTLKIPALAKQYVLLPIVATKDGATYTPTSDTVEAAIIPAGDTPVTGDFVAASWEPNTTSIRVLIGPGSTIGTLDAGYYDCYTRATDNPEIPVLLHGTIAII